MKEFWTRQKNSRPLLSIMAFHSMDNLLRKIDLQTAKCWKKRNVLFTSLGRSV